MESFLGDVRGLGGKRIAELEAAGIFSKEDLIRRLPVSYRDYRVVSPVSALRPGTSAVFSGALARLPTIRRVGALSILSAVFEDETGLITAQFFNQPYLRTILKVGKKYTVSAYIERFGGQKQAQSPVVIPENDLGAIMPVYPPMKSFPQKTYRETVRTVLPETRISDMLPEEIMQRNGLISLSKAYAQAHFPADSESLAAARRRLAFDELFYYQIAIGMNRARDRGKGVAINASNADIQEIIGRLPFRLTNAQTRAVGEIMADLASESPAARLLQGDVGSGKTAVAQVTLYACVKAGFQCALMAPTEVLARQHFDSFKDLLEPMGIRVGLLIGAMTVREHRAAHTAISQGEWDIVIGTHALITEKVVYKNLGFVITDEQHRFGVNQRQALSMKGEGVNVLVMSATPIPRSLSLILYGDLDVSVLDELPPGRTPVKTHIVREQKREGMYGFIAEQIAKGRQGYVVCPLIEKSEAMDLVNAAETYEKMREKMPGVKIALVHGAMKTAEKKLALDGFYSGETDILVSTTVIEVGVNVPNATFMVIEDAHRFGLAQLHQLRGRVGRGSSESFCFLMSDGGEKLKILVKSNDGFVIAQKDLELRGPGEVLGTRQSGLLDAGVVSGMEDALLLERTHKEARDVLRAAGKYAELICDVSRIYGERIEKMAVN